MKNFLCFLVFFFSFVFSAYGLIVGQGGLGVVTDSCTGTISICTGAYDSAGVVSDTSYMEVAAQGAVRTICKVTTKLKAATQGGFHVEIWDAAGSAQIGGDSDSITVTVEATFLEWSVVWSSDKPTVPDADFRVYVIEEAGAVFTVYRTADTCYGGTAYEFFQGGTGKNFDIYLVLYYDE